MHSLALTGSAGSGKSTALRFFRQCGIPAIDCDAIVRKLYRQKGIQSKLLRLFGTANRKELSSVVFRSARKRKKLEKILHPLVWKQLQRSMKKFKKQGKRLVVVDVPLLFEARWQHYFDSTCVVFATRKQCLARLQRSGLTRKEAGLRLHAQLPLKKKIKKARFLINNTGGLQKTKKQVKAVIAKLGGNFFE